MYCIGVFTLSFYCTLHFEIFVLSMLICWKWVTYFAVDKVSRAVSKHNTPCTLTKNLISQTEPLIPVEIGTYYIGREVQFNMYFICFKCENFRASKDVYHSSSLSDMVTAPLSPVQDDVFWSVSQNEEQPPKVREARGVWRCRWLIALCSVPLRCVVSVLWTSGNSVIISLLVH